MRTSSKMERILEVEAFGQALGVGRVDADIHEPELTPILPADAPKHCHAFCDFLIDVRHQLLRNLDSEVNARHEKLVSAECPCQQRSQTLEMRYVVEVQMVIDSLARRNPSIMLGPPPIANQSAARNAKAG